MSVVRICLIGYLCVTQLEELKFENDELRHVPQQASEEQGQRIKELQKTVSAQKAELKRWAEAEAVPSDELIGLKKEMKRLKVCVLFCTCTFY